jgi:hypothetical protein
VEAKWELMPNAPSMMSCMCLIYLFVVQPLGVFDCCLIVCRIRLSKLNLLVSLVATFSCKVARLRDFVLHYYDLQIHCDCH